MLTFRALAVHQSESRKYGLYVVYEVSSGATLLVETWERKKTKTKKEQTSRMKRVH